MFYGVTSMNGTNLYRALISAGADEQVAKEAANDNSEMVVTLAELKITSRLTLGLVIALLLLDLYSVEFNAMQAQSLTGRRQGAT